MREFSPSAIEELVPDARALSSPYLEFLRTGPMSVGVYVLAAGAVDAQSPHAEDELYFVVRGQGRFRNGETEGPVRAGDVLYVPAHRPHRFAAIEEELVLLVVFAPPESAAPTPPVERSGPDRPGAPPSR
ncbi:MAG: cupin domain-containing protein [Thermoplasmata archaeon]|nr:cupin domain-containing protein [Thermoplasmata archaeon]